MKHQFRTVSKHVVSTNVTNLMVVSEQMLFKDRNQLTWCRLLVAQYSQAVFFCNKMCTHQQHFIQALTDALTYTQIQTLSMYVCVLSLSQHLDTCRGYTGTRLSRTVLPNPFWLWKRFISEKFLTEPRPKQNRPISVYCEKQNFLSVYIHSVF